MRFILIALSILTLTHCKALQNMGFTSKSSGGGDGSSSDDTSESLFNLIRNESEARETEFPGARDGLPDSSTCPRSVFENPTASDAASIACVDQVMKRVSVLMKPSELFTDAMTLALSSLERASASLSVTNPLMIRPVAGQDVEALKSNAKSNLSELMGNALYFKQKLRANLVPTIHFDESGAARCINLSWMFTEFKVSPSVELPLVEWEDHSAAGAEYKNIVIRDWLVRLPDLQDNPLYSIPYIAAEFSISYRASSELMFIPINRSYTDAAKINQIDKTTFNCTNKVGQQTVCGVRVVKLSDSGKCPRLSVY